MPESPPHTSLKNLKLKMVTACQACTALVAWAGILSLLASVANFVHLTPDSTRTLESSADVAEQALGVETLSDVRVSHLRELASLSEFTAVFTHLGRRAEYTSIAKLEGNFETRWLPLGVWRSLLLMGGAGGALVEEGGGGGAPAWRGQRFIKATRITDAWGDNLYRTSSGQQMRGHGFFVEYDIPSDVDGAQGVATLDYGSHGGNGWSLASAIQRRRPVLSGEPLYRAIWLLVYWRRAKWYAIRIVSSQALIRRAILHGGKRKSRTRRRNRRSKRRKQANCDESLASTRI